MWATAVVDFSEILLLHKLPNLEMKFNVVPRTMSRYLTNKPNRVYSMLIGQSKSWKFTTFVCFAVLSLSVCCFGSLKGKRTNKLCEKVLHTSGREDCIALFYCLWYGCLDN